jgi:hypothetical protein
MTGVYKISPAPVDVTEARKMYTVLEGVTEMSEASPALGGVVGVWEMRSISDGATGGRTMET